MKIGLSLQYVCNSYQKKTYQKIRTKKSYHQIKIKTRNFILVKPTKNFSKCKISKKFHVSETVECKLYVIFTVYRSVKVNCGL